MRFIYVDSYLLDTIDRVLAKLWYFSKKSKNMIANNKQIWVHKFHQISFQNPKNYSYLDLKHLNNTLKSFSIDEIINCESLMNNFSNLEEISCYGCAHPIPESSKNWPSLKKFAILRYSFDNSILSPNLQKMTNLENFHLVSDDLKINDVKPYLPTTCNINIERENMTECSKDNFIVF